MAEKKKDWVAKRDDDKDLPKIVEVNDKAAEHWGGRRMFIPSPKIVDQVMRTVPRGQVITVSEIRERLAKEHKTDIACPLTTGIFTWIAANAAEQEAMEGRRDITPYWRTLKSEGELNPKYPGGSEHQRELLEAEGHKVVARGKRLFAVLKNS